MVLHHKPKKSLKKKILTLENQAVLLVEIFLIHNLRTKRQSTFCKMLVNNIKNIFREI